MAGGLDCTTCFFLLTFVCVPPIQLVAISQALTACCLSCDVGDWVRVPSSEVPRMAERCAAAAHGCSPGGCGAPGPGFLSGGPAFGALGLLSSRPEAASSGDWGDMASLLAHGGRGGVLSNELTIASLKF